MHDDCAMELDVSLLPTHTDEALALRFASEHAENLRYVAPWGRWLLWNGCHWKRDDTLFAFDEARRVCREAAVNSKKERVAAVLGSAKTVAAVERLARADRLMAATVEQWDEDPWLLNTPAGVIDLRTGKARAHRPEDYMTRITAAAPEGQCPTFLAVLRRAWPTMRQW